MTTPTTLRPDVTGEREWQVRCDLAALYRVFVRYGWTDLIFTHISARHPDEPGRYLINPFGSLFEEITASSLLVVDFGGNVVRGERPYNEAGHAIHSAVLGARPDVSFVLHTHTRAGMAVSCMKCGLLPLTQQAMFVCRRVAYHAWDVQTSDQECEALARDLGDSNAMIMHNHGLLACGPGPGEAFVELYNLETACKVQVDVLGSGQEPVLPAEAALERTARAAERGLGGALEWTALRRWLDREQPDYAT